MSLDGVHDIRALVWDFDGVLNRAGRPECWLPLVARELGIDAKAMERAVFRTDRAALFEGREDVLDRIQAWLDTNGAEAEAEDVLELWLPADHDPDPELGRLLDALAEAGLAHLILTNSDARRARWITHQGGWGERVDAVLSSSAIGAMVPAPATFQHVQDLLALPPHQILFISATPAHVEAAEKRGWLGWDHTPGGARALALALMPLLVT